MSIKSHFLGNVNFLEPVLLNPIPHCFLQVNFIEFTNVFWGESCNGLEFDAYIFLIEYRDLNAAEKQVY